MICSACGRHISLDYVAMADECPGCGESPVIEKVTLPLDPQPWLHEQPAVYQDPAHMTGFLFQPEPMRRADGGIDNAIWAPRSGYSQNMEDYGQ